MARQVSPKSQVEAFGLQSQPYQSGWWFQSCFNVDPLKCGEDFQQLTSWFGKFVQRGWFNHQTCFLWMFTPQNWGRFPTVPRLRLFFTQGASPSQRPAKTRTEWLIAKPRVDSGWCSTIPWKVSKMRTFYVWREGFELWISARYNRHRHHRREKNDTGSQEIFMITFKKNTYQVVFVMLNIRSTWYWRVSWCMMMPYLWWYQIAHSEKSNYPKNLWIWVPGSLHAHAFWPTLLIEGSSFQTIGFW